MSLKRLRRCVEVCVKIACLKKTNLLLKWLRFNRVRLASEIKGRLGRLLWLAWLWADDCCWGSLC